MLAVANSETQRPAALLLQFLLSRFAPMNQIEQQFAACGD
jgi:hypothetical protein